MAAQIYPRREPPPPIGRRELFAGIGLALSGLLLAGCPGKSAPNRQPQRAPGGSMYRRY